MELLEYHFSNLSGNLFFNEEDNSYEMFSDIGTPMHLNYLTFKELFKNMDGRKDLNILEHVKLFIILFETKFPKLKTVKLFKFCLMRKRIFKIQASNRIFEEKRKQRSTLLISVIKPLLFCIKKSSLTKLESLLTEKLFLKRLENEKINPVEIYQKILKEKHLKLFLEKDGQQFDAIWFNRTEELPRKIQAAYRLDANEYNGRTKVQLLLEYAEAVKRCEDYAYAILKEVSSESTYDAQ
jgi:hypothetical protein